MATSLLWGVVIFGAALTAYLKVDLLSSGGHLFTPLYPLVLLGLIAGFSTFQLLTCPTSLEFYEDEVSAKFAFRAPKTLQYSQIELETPLSDMQGSKSSKFGIRWKSDKTEGSEMRVRVPNPKVESMGNNFLYDWLERKKV